MRRNQSGDGELLAAYVDGVAELSLDERRRVDDLLARDPALRARAAETRAIVAQLRDLPRTGGEPDWSALQQQITAAVTTLDPSPWWARPRWRFLGAGVALALATALLLAGARDSALAPAIVARVTATSELEPLASLPLWLDGTDLDVAFEAAELFDLEWELDADSLPATAELLPPSDLGWVDELAPAALDRAEQLLDRPHPPRGRT